MTWSDRPEEERAAVLRILLERAPVGVAYLDRDLRYVAVNDVMAAINGLPAAEHIGRTPREVVPDLSARLERLVAERVFRRAESVLDVTLVGETPAAPGRLREWRASFHPVGPLGDPPGGRPAVFGLCILAVEVSAEREAEEQRRRLQAVLAGERARLDAVVQQLSVGIAVVAVRSGRVLVHNAAASRITGIRSGPVGEVLARLPTYRPDGTLLRWEERPVVRAMETGATVIDESLVIVREDGERLRLRVSATPLRAGRTDGDPNPDDDVVVVTFEDVTERHRNQLALELLARLGDVLSGLDELPGALGAAARACVGELADACAVYLRDDAGAIHRVAGAHPDDEVEASVAGELTDDLSERRCPEVRVIESGRTVYAPAVTDRGLARHVPDPLVAAAWCHAGVHSVIVTPIHGPAGPVGALALAMVRPNRRFAPGDVDVAERLAERFAAGIAQRQAHDRTRRLQLLAAALSEAASPAETRTTALRAGAEVTGATHAALLTIDAGGVASALGRDGAVRPVAATDLSRLIRSADSAGSAGSDGPAGPARGDAPVGAARPRVEAADLLRARFGTPPLRIGELEAACWAALPLQVGDGSRVVLAFGFRAARDFPPEEQALLSAAAEQVEVALERAERFEAERGGRRRAEQVQALTEELAVAERPEQVLAALTGRARLLLGATAALVVVDDPSQPRRLRAWRDPTAPRADPAEMDEAGAVIDEVALPEALLAALHAGLPSVTGTAADWPLTTGGRSSGALHYDFSPPLGQRAVGEVAVTLAAVAALSGQALGRTGRSAFEHEVAVTLQRAMLPLQIDATDLDVAAAYQPASERMEVGGDWYDVLPLDDGRLALIVGDVVGRGLPAATAMGRLRHASRALRFVHGPAQLLSLLDPVAAEDASTRFATVVCVVVDAARGTATYATAGHPPPLLRDPDGTVALLEGANSLPLGLRGAVVRPEATIELPAWAMLLLYTDGLVERRGESIDAGLTRLCDVVASQRDVASRQVVDRAVAQLLHGGEHHDDVAILCAQRLPLGSLRYRFAGHPEDLAGARHALAGWLEDRSNRRDAEGLVLAVGEALANAVEHAQAGDGGSIELTAWEDGDEITVRVRDRGLWRGGGAVTPFGGRGLGIMEVLVDEVTIEHGAPPGVSGTTVVLRRRAR